MAGAPLEDLLTTGPAELVDLDSVEWWVPGDPERPAPAVVRLGEPDGVHIEGFLAFTTPEACRAAIEKYCAGSAMYLAKDPAGFNRAGQDRGLRVFVDLVDEGDGWVWHSYTTALMSKGGDA